MLRRLFARPLPRTAATAAAAALWGAPPALADAPPLRPLSGRSALITGSTSGIGLSVAEQLAEQGCNVVLNGFGDAGEIDALQHRLRERHGVQVVYVPADLTRPEEIRSMVGAAEAALGAVDILVNNAGMQHVSPVRDFPEARWDQIIALNLSAVFHATKAVLPGMSVRGYGRVINVASAHGRVASVNKSAYVASKHGVVGLTKATALETAGSGVTCNAVCPGWVLTLLVQKQIESRVAASGRSLADETKALVSEKMPSGQPVEPEHLGALVAFLCSPAAAQITGAELSVDGGWTAQ